MGMFEWCVMICVTFNPVLAWGQLEHPCARRSFVNVIGIGRWRLEKQYFQGRCVDAVQRYQPAKLPELQASATRTGDEVPRHEESPSASARLCTGACSPCRVGAYMVPMVMVLCLQCLFLIVP